jgi:hypothetical protein
MEQMEFAGWDTDIELTETYAAHVERFSKTLAAMKKK